MTQRNRHREQELAFARDDVSMPSPQDILAVREKCWGDLSELHRQEFLKDQRVLALVPLRLRAVEEAIEKHKLLKDFGPEAHKINDEMAAKATADRAAFQKAVEGGASPKKEGGASPKKTFWSDIRTPLTPPSSRGGNLERPKPSICGSCETRPNEMTGRCGCS